MKSLFNYLLLTLLSIACLQTSAQVYDMSTGIDVNSNLIAIGQPDDTWTICLPSGNPNNIGSYQAVNCGTGVLDNSGPPDVAYAGKDPSVRWLSPDLNALGEHLDNSAIGNYYFRTEFTSALCDVQSAVFNFAHIGSDNKIDQIIVNGNIHAVNYTFNPWSNGVTLPIPVGEIIANGVNEIKVRMYNAGSWTGMEINGNLTITGTPMPDANFSVSLFPPSSLTATANVPGGSHYWEVYSSPNGNAGTWSLLGTYNTPSINVNGGGPCYLIKHTVDNGECGPVCVAQTICSRSCDDTQEPECGELTPPMNLAWDPATGVISWTPVPGAVGYQVEITVNDPLCCRPTGAPDEVMYAPVTVDVPGNTYIINFQQLGFEIIPRCFSFRVKALCPNGLSATSELKCVSFGDGMHEKRAATGSNLINKDEPQVSLYPNPAKGMVAIDIEVARETGLDIRVMDIAGKTVKTLPHVKTTQNRSSVSFNTESLAKGTYLVKIVTSDNQVITKKLVIE